MFCTQASVVGLILILPQALSSKSAGNRPAGGNYNIGAKEWPESGTRRGFGHGGSGPKVGVAGFWVRKKKV